MTKFVLYTQVFALSRAPALAGAFTLHTWWIYHERLLLS